MFKGQCGEELLKVVFSQETFINIFMTKIKWTGDCNLEIKTIRIFCPDIGLFSDYLIKRYTRSITTSYGISDLSNSHCYFSTQVWILLFVWFNKCWHFDVKISASVWAEVVKSRLVPLRQHWKQLLKVIWLFCNKVYRYNLINTKCSIRKHFRN